MTMITGIGFVVVFFLGLMAGCNLFRKSAKQMVEANPDTAWLAGAFDLVVPRDDIREIELKPWRDIGTDKIRIRFERGYHINFESSQSTTQAIPLSAFPTAAGHIER